MGKLNTWRQAPTVAFNAFADVWPRAAGNGDRPILCTSSTGRTLTFFTSGIHFQCTDYEVCFVCGQFSV